MSEIKRNLRFIGTLISLRARRLMAFRLSFFAGSIVDSSLFITWLLMFSAIYGRVDGIGGWSRGEMTIFIGTYSLLNALNMTLYFFGVIGLPGKIKSGDLDHYLTKPVSPLLRLTFEKVDLGSAPLILVSVLIILAGVAEANVAVTLCTALGYIALVLCMCVLYYDLELILRTIPFFVISASSIERLEGAAFEVCMRVPGTLFTRGFKILFYYIAPYGVMATVPAQVLTGMATPGGVAQALGILIVFTAFSQWFFRFGLKHYKSASS